MAKDAVHPDLTVAALMARIAALEARLGADPDEEAKANAAPYARVVYRRGHKKGQIDHPGVLAKKVHSEAELAAALEDGWQDEALEPLDHEDAEALIKEPVRKSKSKAA